MTIKTDLSKKQLATVLSALDPANKGEALRAIGRSAAKLGLTTEDVLAAAPADDEATVAAGETAASRRPAPAPSRR